MSVVNTWIIESMQCVPAEGSLTDVVVTAAWRCNGEATSGDQTYFATQLGVATFPMPSGTFTPYDQLTQEQVLGWCWANGVPQAAIEEANTNSINEKINPPVVTLPLPWATSAA